MLNIHNAGMCKTTIHNALVAVSARMEPIADEISGSLKHSTHLNADETTILIEKKHGLYGHVSVTMQYQLRWHELVAVQC